MSKPMYYTGFIILNLLLKKKVNKIELDAQRRTTDTGRDQV